MKKGDGLLIHDERLQREVRCVIIEVYPPEQYKSCPGIVVDFQEYGAENLMITRPIKVRRFFPLSSVWRFRPDPAGPYAPIVPFLCANHNCGNRSLWGEGQKGTALPHCPNCSSRITVVTPPWTAHIMPREMS